MIGWISLGVSVLTIIVGGVVYTKITGNDLKHLTVNFKEEKEKNEDFRKGVYKRMENAEKEMIRIHGRINELENKVDDK